MELEELKEKWKMLSDEVANQKLITHKILEKAVNDKVKTMVSDYKYLSILAIALVFIAIFLSIKIDIDYKLFTIIVCVIPVPFLIWGFFAMKILSSSISPTLSVYEREGRFLKYKRQERLCYILIAVIYLPIFIVWSITFENNRGFPLWLSIVRITILFIIPCYISYKYSRRKMKKIEDSFKEYKEFMEDNQ